MMKKYIRCLLGCVLFCANGVAMEEDRPERVPSTPIKQAEETLSRGWVMYKGYPTPPKPKDNFQFMLLLGFNSDDPFSLDGFKPVMEEPWDGGDNGDNATWGDHWVRLMECYKSKMGRAYTGRVTFDNNWGKHEPGYFPN